MEAGFPLQSGKPQSIEILIEPTPAFKKRKSNGKYRIIDYRSINKINKKILIRKFRPTPDMESHIDALYS